MGKRKVLIAVPMTGKVDSQFMTSMMGLETKGLAKLACHVGSLVYSARNALTMQAIEGDFEYILWLDSDMTFESDLLTRLLDDMEQGYDFVAGLCFKKEFPVSPVIAKKLWWEQTKDGIDHGMEVYSDYPKDQIFEVAGAGLGCAMMKTQLTWEVGETFRMSPFMPLPQMGEDFSFCWRLGRMGKKMYCDSSVKLGHIGTYIYSEDDYINDKN